MAVLLIALGLMICPSSGLTPMSDLYIAQMERLGQVAYEFYNPAAGPNRNTGETLFTLSYQVPALASWHEIKPEGSRVRLRIIPAITAIRSSVRHHIRLPSGYALSTGWYRNLVQHEFDHVAISTDERPRLLLKHLLLGVSDFEREVPAETRITDKFVRAIIKEELDHRKDAVVELIRHGYEELDHTTHHGENPLPNRKEFFVALFTEEGLQRAHFKYLEEARALLKTMPYRSNKTLQRP